MFSDDLLFGVVFQKQDLRSIFYLFSTITAPGANKVVLANMFVTLHPSQNGFANGNVFSESQKTRSILMV